jgi:hypothetical protein
LQPGLLQHFHFPHELPPDHNRGDKRYCICARRPRGLRGNHRAKAEPNKRDALGSDGTPQKIYGLDGFVHPFAWIDKLTDIG